MSNEMLAWAIERTERLNKDAREAVNLFRTAQRDLNAIKSGKPSAACDRRYCDWKSMQPKKETKG